jgi:hypothetical protein
VASNFFIALATAIGSAALLLSVLYVCVRLFAPRKLDERIPTSPSISISASTLISVPSSIQGPTVKPSSVEQQRNLEANIRALGETFPHLHTLRGILGGKVVISDFVTPDESGMQIAERLSQLGHQGPMVVFFTTKHQTASIMGPYRSKATEPQEPPPVPLLKTNKEALAH